MPLTLHRAHPGPAEPVLWGEVAVLRGYAAAVAGDVRISEAGDTRISEAGDTRVPE